MAKIIVVNGYAGSGKSSHCMRLSQEGYSGMPVQHISAGNLLRGIRTGISTSVYSDIINSRDAPSPLPDGIVGGAILESIEECGNATPLVLIDGYPRHPNAVESFRYELKDKSHLLLGTIALQVSMDTSITRILKRGERAGEKIKAHTLEEFAIQRYDLDQRTTNISIDALSRFAPVEIMDASGEINSVYSVFKRSINNLLLHYSSIE